MASPHPVPAPHPAPPRGPAAPSPFRLLAGVVIVALATVGGLQGLALAAVQRADAAWQAGDVDAALSGYQEAVARAPWDAAARERLAAALVDSGAYTEAAAAYHASAALGDWTPARHVGLGRALQGLGQEEQALTAYQAALARDAAYAPALRRVSPMYWQREDWTAAEIGYGALLVAAPDLPAAEAAEAHYRYALLVFSSAPGVALEHLAHVAGDPAYAGAAAALIAALDATGDAGAVEPAFRAARLGVGLIAAEEYALAGRLFQQAVDANPSYGEAYAYLGMCQDRLGRDGLIYFNRALLLSPDSALVHMLAGYHWRTHGQWTAAREEFKQALDLDTHNAAAAAEIGQMYLAEGKPGAAEVWLEAATELAPEQAGFWLLLAQFYTENTTQVERANAAAQHAYALAPQDAQVLDVLGWTHWQAGRQVEAVTLLERATAIDAELASAAYHLGLVYLGQGLTRAGQQMLERALALEPEGRYGRLAQDALALLHQATPAP